MVDDNRVEEIGDGRLVTINELCQRVGIEERVSKEESYLSRQELMQILAWVRRAGRFDLNA